MPSDAPLGAPTIRSLLSPVAVFAYRRPGHLLSAMSALSRCPEFSLSPVFVFVDGPRIGEEGVVRETRKVAERFQASNVKIYASDHNIGLANSIIRSVSHLTNEFGRVIVVEDDLVVHPATLRWLNDGLDIYAHDDRVMQVSAYQYRVPEFEERIEGTFQRFATTWGWATWKRAWEKFDPLASGWDAVSTDLRVRRAFDADGNYPFSEMLEKQMRGRIDSWGIRWSWSVFRAGGLTLMPPRTLIRNDGFTDQATHNTLGWAKRFALAPTPKAWDGQDTPRLPGAPMLVEADERAFRRGLLRTNARRNARIKLALASLGLQRFA
ncbi:MAG: glycosyltransferase family 2 protein [Alphaproteobacteria bacterium]|nr:MAG: glycosyltransferase family 2 protein [Alphaproteobacteria bacterium]